MDILQPDVIDLTLTPHFNNVCYECAQQSERQATRIVNFHDACYDFHFWDTKSFFGAVGFFRPQSIPGGLKWIPLARLSLLILDIFTLLAILSSACVATEATRPLVIKTGVLQGSQPDLKPALASETSMADNGSVTKAPTAYEAINDAMSSSHRILQAIEGQAPYDPVDEKDLTNGKQQTSQLRSIDQQTSREEDVGSPLMEAVRRSNSTRSQPQALHSSQASPSTPQRKENLRSPPQAYFSPHMSSQDGHAAATTRPSSAQSSRYSIATSPNTFGNAGPPLHCNQNMEAYFNHSFIPPQAGRNSPFGSPPGVGMQPFNPYGANIPYGLDGLRVNPKLLLARRNSPASSVMHSSSLSLAPSPRGTPSIRAPFEAGPRDVSYVIRGFDNEAGNLYAVCRAVPYLLGPKSMLDALATMRGAKLPNEAFVNNEGKVILDPKKLSFIDKALVFILFLLRSPLQDHDDSVRQLLSRFEYQQDALVVYKDMGTDKPPACTNIKVSDWGNMAIEWLYIGNPGNVSPDRPDAVTPWEKIQPYLQARGILNKYITKALYEQWILIPEEYLHLQLNEFVRSGEYEKLVQGRTTRNRSRRPTSRLGLTGNAIHYTPPSPSDPLEWGAKRFTHEHPCGKLVDYHDGRHDNALLSEARHASDEKEKKAHNADPGRSVAEDEKLCAPVRPRWRTKAWWKKIFKYFLIVLVVTGVVAGIGCGVYFHLSRQAPGGRMKNVVEGS
ncbi:hypothetical protein DM02DRAFT_649157 [Periconia macrospinosa]|uniref:Uncharacterized protein n=1 Tax=Periconia macrospinosa TaxID=97972 RepID=A0A2V1ED12_9PLEO|nr:hypothetical protein DM02DRAFT_649157 [Periconia macrospinosa]